ncbi:WW domain-binding protein 11-like [Penaeus japonicus]|uniref:WW domain-binding protein 11-like n=1 Tax=Penaeus japonicus TaxID=27405 RepID=UPI001C70EBF1|nr:WW domain-binding protein 11-like [Penaeus japonicus]
MVRPKAPQAGSRPPTPEETVLLEGPRLGMDPGLTVARSAGAAGAARSDSGSPASSDVSGLQLMEARLVDRLEAQIGRQLARMQEHLEGRMQAQMQALASSDQPVGPSTATEDAAPASAAPPPSLPSAQPCLGEDPEQSSHLPPAVPAEPRLPQRSAPLLSGSQPAADVDLMGPRQVGIASARDQSAQSAARLPPQPPASFMAEPVPQPPVRHLGTSYGAPSQGPSASASQPLASQPSAFHSFANRIPPVHLGDHSWTRPFYGSGRDEVPFSVARSPSTQGIQQARSWSPGSPNIELATLPATLGKPTSGWHAAG